jgi:acyl-coenzyme A synthetase/AMP-(fatty) acid ligase
MTTLQFQPAADRYYAEGYWRSGDLWSDVAAQIEAHPDKVALHEGDRSVSYRDLGSAAVGLSARLAQSSVKPGDVVLLLGRNSLETAVALLGCLHRGAVIAPLPPMFSVPMVAALIGQTGAKALVSFGGEKEIAKCAELEGEVPLVLPVTPSLVDEVRGEEAGRDRIPAEADALAMVLHSSGTTSKPKGIMHSSNTIRYASENVMKKWQLDAESRYLVVCEFGFVGSLVFGYFPLLLSGATGVLLPRWDADEAFRLIDEHRCTYVLLMPTHAADLLKRGETPVGDVTSIRSLGAPGLARERREGIHALFGRMPLGCYGLSEVPGNTMHEPDEGFEKVLVTEGMPFEGTDQRILDANENELPPGEQGSIVLNGPSRFLGFLNNDGLTRESLTEWGGYRTGDVGKKDEDGHLVFVGRSKDIIRRGGVTLVPAEIEPVILRHPAVHEVALVPLPDDRLGERACAALILEPGHAAPTLPELQAFLTEQGTAKYAWPERIEVFDDFPRTSSLKPIKYEIVKQVLERAPATA